MVMRQLAEHRREWETVKHSPDKDDRLRHLRWHAEELGICAHLGSGSGATTRAAAYRGYAAAAGAAADARGGGGGSGGGGGGGGGDGGGGILGVA